MKQVDPYKLKGFIKRLKQAYQQLFAGPGASLVLSDLAQYCRAYESTFDPDPRVHARLEGRRDVWLKIQAQLKLSDDDLYRVVTNGQMPPIDWAPSPEQEERDPWQT